MSGYRALFVEAYPKARGSQRSLAMLLGNLPPDVDATVLCVVDTEAARLYQAAGVPTVQELPPPALRSLGGGFTELSKVRMVGLAATALLPFVFRMRRRLRQLAPDIVHCNQARGLLLVGPAARSLGIPVVWHLRGVSPLRGALAAAADRLCQRVICVSSALVPGVRTPAKARVVANGIDVEAQPAPESVQAAREAIAAARAERGLGPGPTLISASSFIPYKGLHHLAEAVREVTVTREECSQLLWVALGDPAAQVDPRYWKDVDRRLLSTGHLGRHLYVAGWKEEPLSWLAAADVTVLPTVEAETYRFESGESIEVRCGEGLPRSVLESMAVGTPVIASRVAGVPEQIEDGVSGRIVRPSDPKELAAAIADLCRDPELRRSMAAAAGRRVEWFSIERMVEGTLAVHRELREP